MFAFQSVHSSHFSCHFLFHFLDHSDHSSAKQPKMIWKWSQKWAKNGPKMATVNNPIIQHAVQGMHSCRHCIFKHPHFKQSKREVTCVTKRVLECLYYNSFKLSKRWDKPPRKPQICCRDKPGPTPLFVPGHYSIKWWWWAAKKKNRQEACSTLHKNIKQLTGCPVGSGTMQKLKTNPCQAFIMHRHANHDST